MMLPARRAALTAMVSMGCMVGWARVVRRASRRQAKQEEQGQPTGYTELDQALTKGADGKLPFAGKTVSIQTQWIGGEGTNFAASVADFATATGIKIQVDSIGSSHETVLKTRIEGGKPPDLAMLAQPTPVLAYAAAGKVIDVATFMDAKKLSD